MSRDNAAAAFARNADGNAIEARALLRLLTYAFEEANGLGYRDCAELIGHAAEQVRREIAASGAIHPTLDLTRVH